MTHRHNHGCGPRGRVEIDIPEALIAMRGGRGWQGNWGPFHFDFGDEGWGGRRGRRSRRMFDAGELRLVLLKLIADQPRHGYDLIRAIEEMTGGAYAPSPGVVYPTLTMRQDMGLIEEQATERARKAFAVSADGEAHLAERQEEVDALIARLTDLGEDKKKTGGAPIGRAVGNLLSALWHRVTREDTDEDRLHEIAA